MPREDHRLARQVLPRAQAVLRGKPQVRDRDVRPLGIRLAVEGRQHEPGVLRKAPQDIHGALLVGEVR